MADQHRISHPGRDRDRPADAERRPQHAPGGAAAREAERAAAAVARSVADHEDRSALAFAAADVARGRSDEAAARGDFGLAAAAWSDAHAFEVIGAEEHADAITVRAQAARAQSSTLPADGPRPGPSPQPATGARSVPAPARVPGRQRTS
ncbi:hypothetical protein ACWCXH_33840 [Kitasatospora sp. NPDC001660]